MKRSPLDYAAYLINRRFRSEYELREKLASKKYPAEAIDQTITTLKELNLIDDTKFAHSYASDKVEFNRRGRFRIALELRRKGVAKETVEQALAEQVSVDSELKAAVSLLNGRQRLWQDLEPQKRYIRSISLLQRRGFSADIIKQAIKKAAEGG